MIHCFSDVTPERLMAPCGDAAYTLSPTCKIGNCRFARHICHRKQQSRLQPNRDRLFRASLSSILYQCQPIPICVIAVCMEITFRCMITSWHGNACRITGTLWGESIFHQCKGQYCGPLISPLLVVWVNCWIPTLGDGYMWLYDAHMT